MRPNIDLLFVSSAVVGADGVEWDTTARNNEPRTYNGTGVCVGVCGVCVVSVSQHVQLVICMINERKVQRERDLRKISDIVV